MLFISTHSTSLPFWSDLDTRVGFSCYLRQSVHAWLRHFAVASGVGSGAGTGDKRAYDARRICVKGVAGAKSVERVTEVYCVRQACLQWAHPIPVCWARRPLWRC